MSRDITMGAPGRNRTFDTRFRNPMRVMGAIQVWVSRFFFTAAKVAKLLVNLLPSPPYATAEPCRNGQCG
jgi:hypothetical protein